MVKMTKAMAAVRLGDVPQDKHFWCSDGLVLKNLGELEAALKGMGEETFKHHVSQTNNDFSNWVRDVIGDEKLSRDLQKSTTPALAAKSVASRIAWLRSQIGTK